MKKQIYYHVRAVNAADMFEAVSKINNSEFETSDQLNNQVLTNENLTALLMGGGG